MKQRIDVSQLQELNPEQQERLRQWWEPEFGDVFIIPENGEEIHAVDRSWLLIIRNDPRFLPLLSVGQCIELLVDKNEFKGFHKSQTDGRFKVYGEDHKHSMTIYDSSELIDALFEDVKSIL